jgi:DNA-binding transcriptional LysR family regulator
MHITQSATSHALKRLRGAYSDQLFVVTKDGMIPTPLASSAYENIKTSISYIEKTFRLGDLFDPLTSTRKFKVMGSEYFELVILPKLMELMEERCPCCKIEVQRLWSEIPLEELESNNIDLMIGFKQYFKLQSGLTEYDLLSDRLICVVGEKNRHIGDRISLDEYLNAQHIYPSPWGEDRNMVDLWLSKKKLKRHISITVQNYLSTPFLVSTTNSILTLPERVFNLVEHIQPMRAVEPPTDDYPSFVVNMIAHRKYENDSGSRMLQSLIIEACQAINTL